MPDPIWPLLVIGVCLLIVGPGALLLTFALERRRARQGKPPRDLMEDSE